MVNLTPTVYYKNRQDNARDLKVNGSKDKNLNMFSHISMRGNTLLLFRDFICRVYIDLTIDYGYSLEELPTQLI